MVFQHLALFPMMTSRENIGYGLRRRGMARERDRQTRRRGAGARRPARRRRQADRPALRRPEAARGDRPLPGARPDVLLLDEPLGALDLKLREHMKIELKQLQHEFGTTFVYITHDQSEALVMSDHVAVMNAGRFEQVGTPQELYYRPQTAFVAGFVGDNNRVARHASDASSGDRMSVATEDGLDAARRAAAASRAGDASTVFVRPEAIALARDADGARRPWPTGWPARSTACCSTARQPGAGARPGRRVPRSTSHCRRPASSTTSPSGEPIQLRLRRRSAPSASRDGLNADAEGRAAVRAVPAAGAAAALARRADRAAAHRAAASLSLRVRVAPRVYEIGPRTIPRVLQRAALLAHLRAHRADVDRWPPR